MREVGKSGWKKDSTRELRQNDGTRGLAEAGCPTSQLQNFSDELFCACTGSLALRGAICRTRGARVPHFQKRCRLSRTRPQGRLQGFDFHNRPASTRPGYANSAHFELCAVLTRPGCSGGRACLGRNLADLVPNREDFSQICPRGVFATLLLQARCGPHCSPHCN